MRWATELSAFRLINRPMCVILELRSKQFVSLHIKAKKNRKVREM
jgi:hypothetical protein